MAGYSRIYMIGGPGGFLGADGINPIEFEIRAGEGNRQWLDVGYFETPINRPGDIETVIPEGSRSANTLIDACIALFPDHFVDCPALLPVKVSVGGMTCLDFAGPQSAPIERDALREVRPHFHQLNIRTAISGRSRARREFITRSTLVTGGQWAAEKAPLQANQGNWSQNADIHQHRRRHPTNSHRRREFEGASERRLD